jgi:putative phage-type endonuclease
MSTTTIEAIEGRTISRETFHADRRRGIGGSDAAGILGWSPFTTPLEVWLDKTEANPKPRVDTVSTRLGRHMEPYIVAEFERATGKHVIRDEGTFTHPDVPYIIGHYDGLIEGEDTGFEAKYVGDRADKSEWGESGTDQVPFHYLLQCQHYLAVSGRNVWYLAALFVSTSTINIYTIQRDDELIEMLLVEYAKFWQSVIDKVQPEFDPSKPHADRIIKRLYPGTDGTTIMLPDDVIPWHDKLAAAKLQRSSAEAVEKEAKVNILAAMGNAAIAKLPDGTGYIRKQVKRAGYTVQPTDFIQLNFSKKAI